MFPTAIEASVQTTDNAAAVVVDFVSGERQDSSLLGLACRLRWRRPYCQMIEGRLWAARILGP